MIRDFLADLGARFKMVATVFLLRSPGRKLYAERTPSGGLRVTLTARGEDFGPYEWADEDERQ